MSLDPIFALRKRFDPKLHFDQIKGFHLDFDPKDGVDIDMNVGPEVEFDSKKYFDPKNGVCPFSGV